MSAHISESYVSNLRRMAKALMELTTPRHHEFNEQDPGPGPDPFDNLIETELELENRHKDYDYE